MATRCVKAGGCGPHKGLRATPTWSLRTSMSSYRDTEFAQPTWQWNRTNSQPGVPPRITPMGGIPPTTRLRFIATAKRPSRLYAAGEVVSVHENRLHQPLLDINVLQACRSQQSTQSAEFVPVPDEQQIAFQYAQRHPGSTEYVGYPCRPVKAAKRHAGVQSMRPSAQHWQPC